MKISDLFAVLALLTVFLTGFGEGGRCYKCSGTGDCGDPFSSAGLKTVDCGDLQCWKIKNVGPPIIGRLSATGEVYRGCVDIHRRDRCGKRGPYPTDDEKYYCCMGDFCNSAPSLRSGTLQMVLLLLALKTVLRMKTFLAVLLLLTVFIGFGEGEKCYKCSGGSCADPFISAGIEVVECGAGVQCMKVKRKNGIPLLSQKGGWVKRACHRREGWDFMYKTTYCSGDFCNSAPSLRPGTLQMVLLLLALKTVLRLKTSLAVLLLLAIFIGRGEGRRCYHCDSRKDPTGADPFNSAGVPTHECSSGDDRCMGGRKYSARQISATAPPP